MARQFLDLPVEIRLKVYHFVFNRGKAVLSLKGNTSSLLPLECLLEQRLQRSSQLLRTCKVILEEARSILYLNTTFHVMVQAYAGNLATLFSDGHTSAPYVRNLVWQLDCDILKQFDIDDVCLQSSQMSHLKSFEIRCRAENWRNSFLGEWCDRQAFLTGRDYMIAYASKIQHLMRGDDFGNCKKPVIIEDRSQLGRGRIILRFSRVTPHLTSDVCF